MKYVQHLSDRQHYVRPSTPSGFATLFQPSTLSRSSIYYFFHSRVLHFIPIVNMRLSTPTIGIVVLVFILTIFAANAHALLTLPTEPTHPANTSQTTQTNTTRWWHKPEVSTWTDRLFYFDLLSLVSLFALYVCNRVYHGTNLLGD